MYYSCRHGTYTGPPGGYDYLCGYCESGDPDPSPNDIRDIIENLELTRKREAEDANRLFEEMTIKHGSVLASDIAGVVRAYATRSVNSEISRWEKALEESLKWAKHDDDQGWMFTRHNQYLDEVEQEEARLEEMRRDTYLEKYLKDTIEDI